MGWDERGYIGMGWDGREGVCIGMGWEGMHGMGWGVLKWDEMEKDGMRWDERREVSVLGWNGMG